MRTILLVSLLVGLTNSVEAALLKTIGVPYTVVNQYRRAVQDKGGAITNSQIIHLNNFFIKQFTDDTGSGINIVMPFIGQDIIAGTEPLFGAGVTGPGATNVNFGNGDMSSIGLTGDGTSYIALNADYNAGNVLWSNNFQMVFVYTNDNDEGTAEWGVSTALASRDCSLYANFGGSIIGDCYNSTSQRLSDTSPLAASGGGAIGMIRTSNESYKLITIDQATRTLTEIGEITETSAEPPTIFPVIMALNQEAGGVVANSTKTIQYFAFGQSAGYERHTNYINHVLDLQRDLGR